MAFGRPQRERRVFGRSTCADLAVVRIDGRAPLRCTIRNISEGGALLVFNEDVWLPYSFTLAWEGIARTEQCEVRHHNGSRAGVMFIRQDAASDVAAARMTSDDVQSWRGNAPPARR